MGVAHRLVVAALVVAPAACSGSDPGEPEAAPVVCSSDAPFLIEDPTPTQAEILDLQVGTGLDDAAAARRVRVQNIATGVREPLELEDPGYLGLRIDEEGDGLVYLTTEADAACERLERVMGGAADGIAVVAAVRSQAEMEELIEEVQDALVDAPDGLVRMVYFDEETQLVEVLAARGAVQAVADELDDLAEETHDLVVVVDTNREPIEGG